MWLPNITKTTITQYMFYIFQPHKVSISQSQNIMLKYYFSNTTVAHKRLSIDKTLIQTIYTCVSKVARFVYFHVVFVFSRWFINILKQRQIQQITKKMYNVSIKLCYSSPLLRQ